MVVAPFFQSEGKVEPYISLDELKFSPTASEIDFTNLVSNGSAQAQDRALYELIVRASSMIDIHCYGKLGSLNATSNTEAGWYRPDRQGNITVHPTFTPILAITDFQVGWGPGQGLAEVTLSTSNVAIDRDQFTITSPSTLGLYFGSLGIAGGRWSYQQNMWAQWTYVNGWANTYTTSTTAAGSTSLNVTDPTGFYPGMQFTIWDGQNDEVVTLASAYVPGTSTLTLAAGTQYRHGSGVNVSTMPAAVKQACIHFVVAMIKERGQGALVLNEIGEPSMGARGAAHLEEMALAYDLLEPFKISWGRS